MQKLYKCSKGCGSIEENDNDEKPVCCGAPMAEVKEEDLFGCAGCCDRCDAGCESSQGEK